MIDATVCTSNSISVSWAECNKRKAFFDRLLLAAIGGSHKCLTKFIKETVKQPSNIILSKIHVATTTLLADTFRQNEDVWRSEAERLVRHSANQRHLIVQSELQIEKKKREKKLLTICDVASLKQNLNSFQPNLPSTRSERLFIMVMHAATASSEAFFIDKSRCEHFKSYSNRIISAASLMNILQNCKILAHPTIYKKKKNVMSMRRIGQSYRNSYGIYCFCCAGILLNLGLALKCLTLNSMLWPAKAPNIKRGLFSLTSNVSQVNRTLAESQQLS
uniref:Uncharacterized protein n=1 Tax=Glossina palpalis gambiensis TaxID=67801 RepID=A0A1B0B5Z3_9MUSC